MVYLHAVHSGVRPRGGPSGSRRISPPGPLPPQQAGAHRRPAQPADERVAEGQQPLLRRHGGFELAQLVGAGARCGVGGCQLGVAFLDDALPIRDELLEVRANAFAASFLMPAEAVRQFVTELEQITGSSSAQKPPAQKQKRADASWSLVPTADAAPPKPAPARTEITPTPIMAMDIQPPMRAAMTVAQGWGVYAASKAGLDQLTRSAAIDLKGTALRVYSLYPGLVETEESFEAHVLPFL